MKIKTAELTGAALDWAVAKCKGITSIDKSGGVWVPMPKEPHFNEEYSPSTNWSQGGPIIEREEIELRPIYAEGKLFAWNAAGHDLEYDESGEYIDGSDHNSYGPTPLIAAMRCYVASKLGDEVEMPDQLMGVNNANPTPT